MKHRLHALVASIVVGIMMFGIPGSPRQAHADSAQALIISASSASASDTLTFTSQADDCSFVDWHSCGYDVHWATPDGPILCSYTERSPGDGGSCSGLIPADAAAGDYAVYVMPGANCQGCAGPEDNGTVTVTAPPDGVAAGDPAAPAPDTSADASGDTSTAGDDTQTVMIVSATKASSPDTAPSPDASQAARIDCDLNVQNPHNSRHVGGMVNVVVVATCTSTVTSISLNAALYRDDHRVKESGATTSYGVKSKQANAAVACSNGTYQGWGNYAVVFPPGYKPQSGSKSKFGTKVNITC